MVLWGWLARLTRPEPPISRARSSAAVDLLLAPAGRNVSVLVQGAKQLLRATMAGQSLAGPASAAASWAKMWTHWSSRHELPVGCGLHVV